MITTILQCALQIFILGIFIYLLICLILVVLDEINLESTEDKEVEVKIVDSSYTGTTTVLLPVGKTLVPVRTPEKMKIIVEYDKDSYVIDGEETYTKFKNRIGNTVRGILRTYIYKDGSTCYTIVKLLD